MQQINTDELQQQLNHTSRELLSILNLFTEEQFNASPFAGSWTAGQVAEHLYMSEKGIPAFFNSHTKQATRPADEKLLRLKEIFFDFNVKFEAASAIKPSEDTKNKKELIELLRKNKIIIINTVNTLDLSQLCTDRQLPVLGELTRYEWLWFIVFHNIRHLRQLKTIYSTFSQH